MTIGFLAYGVTYMRGLAGTYSALGLTLRGLAIAVIITAGDILVALSSGLIAGTWKRTFGV